MTLARRQLVSLNHTPYYHCTARCVRRAFLCGKDVYSGRDFGHRRQWLENRLSVLASVFAIDLLAYAIMSNHYHVVVRLSSKASEQWSNCEVVKRWRVLHPAAAEDAQPEIVALWRERLGSLSWYMREINEPLARWANREDDCTGRFWEGRFKSQALLDEHAVLACMAYVDLNPVRAGLADTPENSTHTSIRARVEGRDSHLARFEKDREGFKIPLRETSYLELVDWTGRAMRGCKRGFIPASAPAILDRIAQHPDGWLREMRYYGRWYYRASGSFTVMKALCRALGQTWLKGMGRVRSRDGLGQAS
ncbi:MAG: hypothetical protein AAGE85_00970 [Pseudomonadota bacterium]